MNFRNFLVILTACLAAAACVSLVVGLENNNEIIQGVASICFFISFVGAILVVLYNEGVVEGMIKGIALVIIAIFLALTSTYGQTSVVGGLAVNNNSQEAHLGIINGSEFPVVFLLEIAHEEWVINDLSSHNPSDHLGLEAEFGWIGPNCRFLNTVGILGYDGHVLPTVGVSRRLWDFNNSSLWAGVQLSPVRQEIGIRYLFNVTEPRYGSGCVFK